MRLRPRPVAAGGPQLHAWLRWWGLRCIVARLRMQGLNMALQDSTLVVDGDPDWAVGTGQRQGAQAAPVALAAAWATAAGHRVPLQRDEDNAPHEQLPRLLISMSECASGRCDRVYNCAAMSIWLPQPRYGAVLFLSTKMIFNHNM